MMRTPAYLCPPKWELPLTAISSGPTPLASSAFLISPITWREENRRRLRRACRARVHAVNKVQYVAGSHDSR